MAHVAWACSTRVVVKATFGPCVSCVFVCLLETRDTKVERLLLESYVHTDMPTGSSFSGEIFGALHFTLVDSALLNILYFPNN